MKKLFLTVATVLILVSMYADKDVEASLCWHSKSISIEELRSCEEITLNNDKYNIFSYKLGVTHKHDNTQDYIEFMGVSEKIDDKFIKQFNDFTPEKLYLEEIIVVDENNEKFKLENVIITVTR